VNIAGFPTSAQFSNFTINTNHNYFAVSPVAWSPGYTSLTPCAMGTGGAGNCTTPGDFDLIVESNIDLEQDRANGVEDVEWVRYQLPAGSTTLFRGVTPKNHWVDPDGATQDSLVPFVQNVMNNASAAQIAQFQALYPATFPGGAPVPIFRYLCDDPSGLTRCEVTGSKAPANVREVEITLIVQAPQPDSVTGNPRLVMLNGRGHRVNPKAP